MSEHTSSKISEGIKYLHEFLRQLSGLRSGEFGFVNTYDTLKLPRGLVVAVFYTLYIIKSRQFVDSLLSQLINPSKKAF